MLQLKSRKWLHLQIVNSQEKASANYGLGPNPFLHVLRYGSQTRIFFFFLLLKGLVKKQKQKKIRNFKISDVYT